MEAMQEGQCQLRWKKMHEPHQAKKRLANQCAAYLGNHRPCLDAYEIQTVELREGVQCSVAVYGGTETHFKSLHRHQVGWFVGQTHGRITFSNGAENEILARWQQHELRRLTVS